MAFWENINNYYKNNREKNKKVYIYLKDNIYYYFS